jgi:hypothetical protein
MSKSDITLVESQLSMWDFTLLCQFLPDYVKNWHDSCRIPTQHVRFHVAMSVITWLCPKLTFILQNINSAYEISCCSVSFDIMYHLLMRNLHISSWLSYLTMSSTTYKLILTWLSEPINESANCMPRLWVSSRSHVINWTTHEKRRTPSLWVTEPSCAPTPHISLNNFPHTDHTNWLCHQSAPVLWWFYWKKETFPLARVQMS